MTKRGILLGILSALFLCVPFPADAGNASDFKMDGSKLVKYAGTDSSVSVPATVQIIGDGAFKGNSKIKNVTIPEGVTAIGTDAFAGCIALKSLHIPDSVAALGKSVFSECTALSSVSIGKGLKDIGSGVFSDCTSLSTASINRENPVFSCEDGVLYAKDKTIVCQMFPGRSKKTYEMPSSVTSITEYAFWGCENLKQAELSSHLKAIPAYAFSNCTGLEKAVIPYSVRSIEMKAFENCANLIEAEVPDTVANVHKTAFDGCTKLNGGASTVSGNQTKTDPAALNPAAKDSVSDNAASENAVSSNAVSGNPAEVSHDGAAKAASVEKDKNVLGRTKIIANNAVVMLDQKGIKVMSGNEAYPEEPKEADVKEKPAPKEKLIISEDGTAIAEQAFYRNQEMKSYTFPIGIKEIGDFAFARSYLTKIVIPEGVTKIDYAAFYHCNRLKEITIPGSVTTIEENAFAQTLWMKNWQKKQEENPFLVVGDGILLAYKGTGSKVRLPENIKQIGIEAFKEHSEITEITLPEGLEAIDKRAFNGCDKLKAIKGGDTLSRIDKDAFEGCPIELVQK